MDLRTVNHYVFPLAILITKGIQFALASLYLGSPVCTFGECTCNIIRAVGRYGVVTHVDLSFSQVVIRERLPHPPKTNRVPCGGHRGSDTKGWLEGDEGLIQEQASGVEVVERETIYK